MTSVPPIPITVKVKPNSKFVKFFTSFAPAHSPIAGTPSASIASLAETRISLMVPAAGATMSLSIFMSGNLILSPPTTITQ